MNANREDRMDHQDIQGALESTIAILLTIYP